MLPGDKSALNGATASARKTSIPVTQVPFGPQLTPIPFPSLATCHDRLGGIGKPQGSGDGEETDPRQAMAAVDLLPAGRVSGKEYENLQANDARIGDGLILGGCVMMDATEATRRRAWAVACSLLFTVAWASQQTIAAGSGIFDVHDSGAAGDGKTLDTAAINKAIDACAQAGGGQVRLTPGRYLSGTVHLKTHVTLFLEAGATLVGTTDLNQYQRPTVPDFMPEAKWGKWHRALILGEGLEDITIAGQGTINGNKVFDPTGEERMRGPHTFVFVNCRNVTVRDVSFVDAANYAIFFEASSDVDVRNVKFTGGWDGVHFRGAPEHPCRNVSIIGCQFYTGDDSIAGRYWENTLISDCVVNSSCNGIRLIGPATHLTIHDCLFYGPGVQPHRTSNRYNMLAGINLQPGAWDATKGDLDDVLISDITMKNVATPFHFLIKSGNTAGRILVSRVDATGVYRAACSVESWADAPFKDVTFRDVSVEFEGGGRPESTSQPVRAPGVDARPLPAWGFYARNVEKLTFEDVRLGCIQDDLRPMLICDHVRQLAFDDLDFPRYEGAADLIALYDVSRVRLRDTGIAFVRPAYIGLAPAAGEDQGRITAGKPFAVGVTVQNGEQEGLANVELTAGEQKVTRCVWLRPNEKKDVVFDGLTAPAAGSCVLRAGDLTKSVTIQPQQ